MQRYREPEGPPVLLLATRGLQGAELTYRNMKADISTSQICHAKALADTGHTLSPPVIWISSMLVTLVLCIPEDSALLKMSYAESELCWKDGNGCSMIDLLTVPNTSLS